MVAVTKQTIMSIKSYQNQAQLLVKNYLLADPFIPYTSIIGGVLAYKVVYDLTQLISSFYSKTYPSLTKIQRADWNNRGISTIHAIFVSALSLYFVFWSDLFSDQQLAGLVVFRSSPLSTFGLGVSLGYFLSDLAMILWLYPALGGIQYISVFSISLWKALWHTFCLFCYCCKEQWFSTTPVLESQWHSQCLLEKHSCIRTWSLYLRYLDIAGMKRSNVYLINGVVIFFAWLIARVLLFGYMFYHVYLHYNQVIKMHTFCYTLVFGVPLALATMNLIWFGKIIKGLKKTLAKRRRRM